MSIKFEKQEDGTYKRTGALPDGTESVWICRDGRRSSHAFRRELALRIVEKYTASSSPFPSRGMYELKPAYSNQSGRHSDANPEAIEGLTRYFLEIGWPDVEDIDTSLEVNAALAVFVSVDNERILEASSNYEIEKDEQGRPLRVQCDVCGAQFFVFYLIISTVSPQDRIRLLGRSRLELREILAREHKSDVAHTCNRPFEIVL